MFSFVRKPPSKVPLGLPGWLDGGTVSYRSDVDFLTSMLHSRRRQPQSFLSSYRTASDCAADHKRLSLGNRKNINSLRNVHVSIIKRNVCDVYYVRFHFAFGAAPALSPADRFAFLPIYFSPAAGLEPKLRVR